jgi:hypothetical protein
MIPSVSAEFIAMGFGFSTYFPFRIETSSLSRKRFKIA